MTDIQQDLQAEAAHMKDTLNDRMEENKDDMNSKSEQDWIEIRVQGKLPERRSNHSAFIAQDFLYVHGGHDLKEGAMNSMWRVDLKAVHQLFQDAFYPVAW